ncbi:UNVERIFIED_CONTAM: putative choline transporter, neither null mutation nor overexpression affects choline transport [Siphonaria sp. JEL0065]|nr:putative choline transporter, neither null mutation nor overexpression affects choline transport [Siphonaria sp. JEL0065]
MSLTQETIPLRPVDSTTSLLSNANAGIKLYPVLANSKNRGKCRDTFWIVPFVCVMGFVAFFGIRGSKLVTNVNSYCDLVPGNALDSALPSASSGSDIYAGCVHYIVSGDLSTARSQCASFAVNSLAGLNSTSTSKRGLPISIPNLPSSLSIPANFPSLPPALQNAFTLCSMFIAAKMPSAPQLCVQYGFSTFFGAAIGGSTQQILDSCVIPVLTTLNVPNRNSINACADAAVVAVLGNSSTTATASVFSMCVQKDPTQAQVCVTNALRALNVPTDTITSLTNTCVTPALDKSGGPVNAVEGCLVSSLGSLFPKQGIQIAQQAVNVCLTPFLNGTNTNPVGVAARCLELGLSKSLGGVGDQVFLLIESSIQNLLSNHGDLAKTFSSSCLAHTVGDLSAGKGFNLQNCLFQGIASQFCHDVVSAGPYSIASGIQAYFSSFRDRVAQSGWKLAETFVVIVGAGVFMAMVWMSVLVVFGEGMILFSIFGTLVNLLVLMIINFIILNIPVAIVLLIYFLFKCVFYVFIWKRIRFASILLSTTVAHLKKNPGAFLLAAFLFVWNAGWCFLFACAYLDLYSPNTIADPNLLTFLIVLLVLGFFWSFEVWKGLLGVSVAGSLGNWYYYPVIERGETDRKRKNVIVSAFGHASTFSLGTICFSSLLLAGLKTGHYFYKKAKNSNSVWVKALVNALFGWLEYVLKLFNLYSLVRVGVRYESYLEACKTTLNLIQTQGLDMLINDDCIEQITSSTSLLGSITLGSIAFITSKIVHHLDWDITLLVVCISVFFGYAMLSIMGVTVEMGVVALFVCVAEDPEVLLRHGRRECGELIEAIVERCRERGWRVPDEIALLEEKMKAGAGGGGYVSSS